MTDRSDHEVAARLATEAGKLLLEVRAELADASQAERKAAGDKRSHDFLMAALAAERPGDAVLSEEGADDPIRLSAERVWIVDPLDGTREFSELGTRRLGGARRPVAIGRIGRGRGRPSRARHHARDPDGQRTAARSGAAAHRGVAYPAAGGRAGGA